MNVQYLRSLQEAIKRLHGCDSKFLENTKIKEKFQGRLVWEGEVSEFLLVGHKAQKCYAWAHTDGKDDKGMRYFVVLGVPPVDSPVKAVRAAIVAESKGKK